VKFGFIPVEDSRYYQEALKQVELAEELGFDSVWLEEHHGTSRHYHPSPLIYLAGFATRSERILLGTDIAILPLYHPVRLAEDVAQLDIMSKGRVILGAAIGYREEEFAAFQTPLKGRGAQFEEMLVLIKRLWSEDNLDFESERYALNNFTLEPKPFQKPRPPIWLGGWGRLSIQRAASLGDAWIPGPTANLVKLKEAQARYNDHLLELEVDPQSRPRPLTRDVVIASSDKDAEELAQSYLLPAYRDEYSSWSHPLIGTSDSTATDILEELRQDRFIIGSPSKVIEQIDYFKEQFGMDHLICRLHFPGMPVNKVLSAVRLIGEEVIPVFNK
jgi:alkanesulfonate monooxygenase SsuD/methylene tetrahydromethanopterin reductase-like flavin-dependent oxidoreductase (luciferase family)